MPSILITAALAVAPALTYVILSFIYRRITSPLRYIPGPKSSSFITGSLKDQLKLQPHELATCYASEYGHVLKYDAFLGGERLYTTDIKALSHILNNGYEYQRPVDQRWLRKQFTFGDGLLSTEGEQHRQQRRTMNPAFGSAHIGQITDIFVDKALQLCDVLNSECAQNGGRVKIDTVDWFKRLTLDIIGLAGFNRDFEALSPVPSEQSKQLKDAFSFQNRSARAVTLDRIKAYIPALRLLPDFFNKEIGVMREKMMRIGQALLHESKTAALSTGQEDKNYAARDVLSLLVKANLTDKANQKMTDQDVVAQISTFIIAGHETTSTSASWALYSLCKDQHIQMKLREELLSMEPDNLTMDKLNSLTYLDYVVKETMRYHAPIAFLPRIAAQDDIVPLAKPYTDVSGIMHDSIRVKKGQEIEIPILAVNVDKSLWGEDALEFKPERWESPPKVITGIPGVWSHMLSFLGGSHSCIGFKFSVVELKVILYTLIRAFEFEFAVPVDEWERTRNLGGIERPCLKSDPDHRAQLHLFITPVRRS